MKRLILIAVFSLGIYRSFAQIDMEYWDKAGYAQIGSGMVFPGKEMKSTDAEGLFAKNGFQLFTDFNFMIKYGFGLGLNVEYDEFLLNKPVYFHSSQADSMETKGNYSTTKVGMNILLNLPVIVVKNKFAINMYGEFTPGFRWFNIPEIDLYYNENVNKYVEVHYRTRQNFMGYLGYSGGLQFLFHDKWGINMSYNSMIHTRHSVNYSVRMFDAFGNLYEGEEYLNNYLNNSGWKLGIIIIFGKD